jgi:hypothetical protein
LNPRNLTRLTLVLLCVSACGGSSPRPSAAKAPSPDEDTPVARSAATGKPAAKRPKIAAADTALPAQDSTQLQREVFAYRGAGRDPFFSLMKSGNSHPLVTDVRVAGISYDAAYPARSVAVLRDTAQHKRYSVRIGDELGRMKVTEIRGDAVVVTLDEFGQERQVVLLVRRSKQQEETP